MNEQQAIIAINLLGNELGGAYTGQALQRANEMLVVQAFDALEIASWGESNDIEAMPGDVGDLLGTEGPFPGATSWVIPPEQCDALRVLFSLIEGLR